MEPLSIQSTAASAQARPVGLQPDLAGLLQHGRVLAGQVLETFGGGSILLGVGRHRVPAQSQVELAIGDRFLFQVEARSGQHLLHVLGAGPTEPDLVRALRAAVGQDRPVAQLLNDLAARLRAAIDGGGGGASRSGNLLKDLAAHVFRPGSDGQELAALLSRSGLRYEAAVASATAGEGGPPPAVTLRGLASLWAKTWSGSLPGAPGSELAGIIAHALHEAGVPAASGSATFTVAAGPGESGLAEVVDRLREALGRAAAALPAGATRATIEAHLQGLDTAVLTGQRELGLLARLLGLDSGVDPRILAQWSAHAALAELEHDLKGLLLRARGALPGGPATEALARALGGLEAEQLLNLARRESQDAWHWSFPVQDGPEGPEGANGELWRTAHLFYRVGHDRDGAGADGGEGDEGAHAHRFVLGIELSQLGPVRAELLLQRDMLGVRVIVTKPEVAARIRSDLVDLRDRIAAADRRVHVSVVEGTPGEASIEPLLSDIRYLRENPLLDLSG